MSKEYSIAFKASGRVKVEACSEEEAKSRALHEVLIPGMWFEDFPVITVDSISVLEREIVR